MDKYKYMKEKMLKTMCPILCVIANISDWLKKNWAIAIVIAFAISVFLLDCFLFFRFEATTLFLGIDYKQIVDAPWDMIRTVGYAGGVLLLVIQIIVSNRRATALEKSAEAALASNVEQRYHNAINNLTEKSSFIRIGAIYNLYHLSQSTDIYDKTIFDIFCDYIKHDKNNKHNINAKEKQIIVDKLFKGDEGNKVLKDIKEINLENTNLMGIDFSNAYLKGALLTNSKLGRCIFDKANLTEATLPTDLSGLSMKGAKLDGIKLYSNTNMKSVELQPFELKGQPKQTSSLKNAMLLYVDLSYADLTEADLDGVDFTGSTLIDVKGLTVKQLSKVKCLHGVKGLDAGIEARLKEEKSELFDKLNNI